MSDEENWDDGGSDEGWEDADGDAGWGNDDEDGAWDDEGIEGSEGGECDTKIQIENLFYEAEDNRRSDPRKALEQFKQCYDLEKSQDSEIFKRFKALERIVTLLFQFKNTDEMIDRYKELLSLASQVTRNDSSESINNVINCVSDSKDLDFLNKIYNVTLDALEKIPGQQRMWFNISMKMCKSQMEKPDFDQRSIRLILSRLHESCKLQDGSDDPQKGSQLLEIYAIEMQLMSKVGDHARLKELFERTKLLNAEINDPRSMSVIRECWGKMWAGAGKWSDAYAEFFAAFLQYQEIGHYRAKQCLKYVVVANMLSKNDANPFDAREAKVYEQDPEIQSIVSLRFAYDNDDIRKFEQILQKNERTITNDPFIKNNVNALLLSVRSRACINLLRPYSRVELTFLARRLRTSRDEVESIVVNLIQDELVHGKLDQITGILDLTQCSTEATQKFNALEQWADRLTSLSESVCGRVAVGGQDRSERETGNLTSTDFPGFNAAFGSSLKSAFSVFGL
eukprot:180732_1